MPKRLDPVAPPPRGDEWAIRFGTTDAANDWTELCAQAPGNTREAWERMRERPLDRSDTQKPLSGTLGTRQVGGDLLPQWQIDITAGARIWYCVDAEKRTVWVTRASTKHPGATESKGKRTSRNR
ncbi:hypothetical protein GCM10027596_31620 [Nocardioides korecus]